jgi:hypothetical protein
MMDMDESSDERDEETPRRVLSDCAHLPGGYHEERPPDPCGCIWCVGNRTRQSAATFVAANQDWREYAKGWSGL